MIELEKIETAQQLHEKLREFCGFEEPTQKEKDKWDCELPTHA